MASGTSTAKMKRTPLETPGTTAEKNGTGNEPLMLVRLKEGKAPTASSDVRFSIFCFQPGVV
ncbi:hypothetical protein CVT25_000449 [Psilocybe cyanescens]|uniref:Uncharacterized protein n=1 Tax=Psilocybe cyanescens TaxID=93625 RepID=A0A409XM39_PSICY|nr:hypothetical protein CVT25_000449 [Psilocybe cyanescens]